jgi:hypothetical protein
MDTFHLFDQYSNRIAVPDVIINLLSTLYCVNDYSFLPILSFLAQSIVNITL